MVLLVVDVDGPGHKRESAWWADELLKLEALAAAHPGGFFYATRGGYRLVYRLASPVVIRTVDDKEAWRERYRRELLYLARRFAIVGDPACSDITRLFRCPKATRTPGGAPEDHPTVGDPSVVGVWTHEPVDDERSEDVNTARMLASMSPRGWGPVLRALEVGRGARTERLRPPNYAPKTRTRPAAKGPKHKRQGREYSRAPRPWRQSYGMHHPEGQALVKLDVFQYSDLKNNPRENLERLVVMYVRSVAISLGVDSLSSVTPSLIVAWCERTTRSVTRS
jgi:hypothetical protein